MQLYILPPQPKKEALALGRQIHTNTITLCYNFPWTMNGWVTRKGCKQHCNPTGKHTSFFKKYIYTYISLLTLVFVFNSLF